MKPLLFITLTALTVIFLDGCKKKKTEDPVPAKSKTELLTAHSWTITSITADRAVDYDGDGDASTDILSQQEDCNDDDFATFSATNSTKTGVVNGGSTLCSGTSQTLNFTWWFNAGETKVTVSYAGGALVEERTILQLDETTFRYTTVVQDNDNVDYTQTVIMTKK